jgi:hypothetical protein
MELAPAAVMIPLHPQKPNLPVATGPSRPSDDLRVLTALAPFLVQTDITQEKYNRSCRMRTEESNDFLTRHGAISPEIPFNYSSYRFDTANGLLYAEVENVETDTVRTFPAQLFTDGDSIVANLMNRDELGLYFRQCQQMAAVNKTNSHHYSFWQVVLSPTMLQDFRGTTSAHACLVIFNHLTKKVYYMDPNATWTHLDHNNRETSQYIDMMFSQYFADTDYEYVWASAWRTPKSIQEFPGRKSYDRGNCATLSLIFAHLLMAGDYLDPAPAYDDLLIALQTCEGMVYNYICYLYGQVKYIPAMAAAVRPVPGDDDLADLGDLAAIVAALRF